MSEQVPPPDSHERVEDPMSADRRTMAIAAAAMLGLIAIGVVSAAIFTRSPCGAIEPQRASAPPASGDVEAVLSGALEDLDPQALAGIADGLVAVAGEDAALTGAADLGGPGRLTTLGDGLAAMGERVTALPGPTETGAAVDPAEAAVVGGGDALYSLALVNELTGQVDALVPIVGEDLRVGDCTDTAQVGVPLAFHLDADDGELLLFRVDDDADDPAVELRDPDGPVWSSPLQLGSGPPGLLAERLGAMLGEGLVVTARRSSADESAPALAALDREDGEPRWSRSPAELDELAPGGEGALVPRVAAVTEDLVLVTLGREGQDAVLLVGLDADDGEARWTSDLQAVSTPRSVGTLGEDLVLLSSRDAATEGNRLHEVMLLDPSDGTTAVLHAAEGGRAAAAVVDDRVLFTVDDALTRLDADGVEDTLSAEVVFDDVRSVDGQAAVLVRSREGGAVVWLGW